MIKTDERDARGSIRQWYLGGEFGGVGLGLLLLLLVLLLLDVLDDEDDEELRV